MVKGGRTISPSDPIRRLIADKMGIERGLWHRVRPASHPFDSQWAPVERWAEYLRRLPAGMIAFLAGHRHGRLLVSHRTAYIPGAIEIAGQTCSHVCLCDIRQLDTPFAGIWVAAQLLDHLLGCDGEPDGPWLSDGGGITPALQEVGRRVQELYALGYGMDEESRQNPRQYLARSLAWYVTDRRALNAADPAVERLLKHTLMDERFWKEILEASRGSSHLAR